MQGRILKADINLFTFYYDNYQKTVKGIKKTTKITINCTNQIG